MERTFHGLTVKYIRHLASHIGQTKSASSQWRCALVSGEGLIYGFRKNHHKVCMRTHVAISAASTHMIFNVGKTEITGVRKSSSKILDKRRKKRPRTINSAASGGLRVCRRNFLQSLRIRRMIDRPRKRYSQEPVESVVYTMSEDGTQL